MCCPAPSQSALSCRCFGISGGRSVPAASGRPKSIFRPTRSSRSPSVSADKYVQFLPEETQDFVEGVGVGHKGAAFFHLDLHELIDLVLPLHVLLQLRLQVTNLVLCCLLLLLHLHQVGVILLEVRGLTLFD